MKRSTRWKELERVTAATLGGRRVVTPWELFEARPDVVVEDAGLVIDCKAYRRFAHHALLDAVQRRYCKPGQTPALVTKAAGQRGAYVTLPLDYLAHLLDVQRNQIASSSPKPVAPVLCRAERGGYGQRIAD